MAENEKSEDGNKIVPMEAVIGELQCPVCLELFSCPTILPCSHILCRAPCAERLFQNSFVRCPICRDTSFVTGGISALPRVISLENIIERYKNPIAFIQADNAESTESGNEACTDNDIPCQLCDDEQPRKATKSCLDCNASYCSHCLKISHPQREPFISHQLVMPRRYPKPKDVLCPRHEVKVNIFCGDCQQLGCLLCSDDAHNGHNVMSLKQAAECLKDILEEGLCRLECGQEAISEAIKSHQDRRIDFKESCDERRNHVSEQCESMINEIQCKKDFFLADIEYEEKVKTEAIDDHIGLYQKQECNLQSVIHFSREVLKEDELCAFIQLAEKVNDRSKNCLEAMSDISPLAPSMTLLNHKVVDFRKEKAMLRNITYLAVPSTPVVAVDKCSRSTTSVVVVLCAPTQGDEIIDEYRVFYWSEEDKVAGRQGTMVFKTPGEERKSVSRAPPNGNAVCLIHDNLQPGTMYYFCVRAYNMAGDSETSDIVNCMTLTQGQSRMTVPEITANQCRSYTCSIQIHSPSPVEAKSGENFYLLYREASANKIWKSIVLCDRVDHRVFGLESDTMFDFIIMVCDQNGECQVSNMVTLRTERSAY